MHQQGFRKENRSVKSLIHGDWNQNLWTEPVASNSLSDGPMRYKMQNASYTIFLKFGIGNMYKVTSYKKLLVFSSGASCYSYSVKEGGCSKRQFSGFLKIHFYMQSALTSMCSSFLPLEFPPINTIDELCYSCKYPCQNQICRWWGKQKKRWSYLNTSFEW